jgi:D-aminoacyl-tRNA deacylase
MRVILQRVLRASVSVNAQVIGEIAHGVMLLVGVTHSDAREQADGLAKKIAGLRIFPSIDGASGFDRSLIDVVGGVLCISQFTLYGETKKGRRPDFIQAAKPDVAAPLIEYFVAQLRAQGLPVQTGAFGADMQVELVNDGPVTLVLES